MYTTDLRTLHICFAQNFFYLSVMSRIFFIKHWSTWKRRKWENFQTRKHRGILYLVFWNQTVYTYTITGLFLKLWDVVLIPETVIGKISNHTTPVLFREARHVYCIKRCNFIFSNHRLTTNVTSKVLRSHDQRYGTSITSLKWRLASTFPYGLGWYQSTIANNW